MEFNLRTLRLPEHGNIVIFNVRQLAVKRMKFGGRIQLWQ